jgi:hypothetical protein
MAIEDAVQPFTITGMPKPVAHVINMSLGNPANDPNYPTSIASDNATLTGATVVASAGNAGRPTPTNPTGEGTIGSPGSARRVLTVGANNDPGKQAEDIVMDRVFDNGRAPERTAVLDPAAINRNVTGFVDGDNKAIAAGQRTDIPLTVAGGSPVIGNPVAQYYVFAGTVSSPADVPDSVAGRIAIARPSGAFAVAANSIVAKGAAAAILIYPGKITIVNSTAPVWSISEEDARYLLDLLSSNDTKGVDPAKGVLSEYPVRISQGAFSPAMADFLRFTVTSIKSKSGRVRVQNADDGGDGVASPAAFDYTAQAGSDQRLAAGETSAARQLKFANQFGEMFEFTAVIRGHQPDTANASGTTASGTTSSGGADGGTTSTGSTSGDASTSVTSQGGTVQQLTAGVLRFTVNPLTRTVTVSLTQ